MKSTMGKIKQERKIGSAGVRGHVCVCVCNFKQAE